MAKVIKNYILKDNSGDGNTITSNVNISSLIDGNAAKYAIIEKSSSITIDKAMNSYILDTPILLTVDKDSFVSGYIELLQETTRSQIKLNITKETEEETKNNTKYYFYADVSSCSLYPGLPGTITIYSYKIINDTKLSSVDFTSNLSNLSFDKLAGGDSAKSISSFIETNNKGEVLTDSKKMWCVNTLTFKDTTRTLHGDLVFTQEESGLTVTVNLTDLNPYTFKFNTVYNDKSYVLYPFTNIKDLYLIDDCSVISTKKYWDNTSIKETNVYFSITLDTDSKYVGEEINNSISSSEFGQIKISSIYNDTQEQLNKTVKAFDLLNLLQYCDLGIKDYNGFSTPFISFEPTNYLRGYYEYEITKSIDDDTSSQFSVNSDLISKLLGNIKYNSDESDIADLNLDIEQIKFNTSSEIIEYNGEDDHDLFSYSTLFVNDDLKIYINLTDEAKNITENKTQYIYLQCYDSDNHIKRIRIKCTAIYKVLPNYVTHSFKVYNTKSMSGNNKYNVCILDDKYYDNSITVDENNLSNNIYSVSGDNVTLSSIDKQHKTIQISGNYMFPYSLIDTNFTNWEESSEFVPLLKRAIQRLADYWNLGNSASNWTYESVLEELKTISDMYVVYIKFDSHLIPSRLRESENGYVVNSSTTENTALQYMENDSDYYTLLVISNGPASIPAFSIDYIASNEETINNIVLEFGDYILPNQVTYNTENFGYNLFLKAGTYEVYLQSGILEDGSISEAKIADYIQEESNTFQLLSFATLAENYSEYSSEFLKDVVYPYMVFYTKNEYDEKGEKVKFMDNSYLNAALICGNWDFKLGLDFYANLDTSSIGFESLVYNLYELHNNPNAISFDGYYVKFNSTLGITKIQIDLGDYSPFIYTVNETFNIFNMLRGSVNYNDYRMIDTIRRDTNLAYTIKFTGLDDNDHIVLESEEFDTSIIDDNTINNYWISDNNTYLLKDGADTTLSSYTSDLKTDWSNYLLACNDYLIYWTDQNSESNE